MAKIKKNVKTVKTTEYNVTLDEKEFKYVKFLLGESDSISDNANGFDGHIGYDLYCLFEKSEEK